MTGQDQIYLGNLRKALDASSIVAITNTAGVIVEVNDKFCEISKFSREELLGQTHSIINSGYHPKSFFQQMWRAISTGKVWEGEIKNCAKDGSEYWVETTIVPFLDENKKPYLYVSIRKDITEKKHMQKEIEHERAKAFYTERMAGLGEMSAGIAHELGNPLGALRGRIEMLENLANSGKVSSEQVLDFVARALRITDRMSKIIRGLRSYARDGSQDPMSQCNLTQLVDDIAEFSGEQLRKRGIELRLIGFDQDHIVDCREAEIGQVIVNLIRNAADAASRLEQKWVEVVLDQIDDRVQISVTDSGTGIPPEIRDKIFQPFFTTKPMGKGTGLGLSISQTIVNAHNGTLTIDAKSPYTRFIVQIPKRMPNEKLKSAPNVTPHQSLQH